MEKEGFAEYEFVIFFFFSMFLVIGGWVSGGTPGVAIGLVAGIVLFYLYYLMYKGKISYLKCALACLVTFFGTLLALGILFPA